MRVLYVAPHPFYTERGSPIATRLMVETLLDLGHEVELLVYHEGDDINHDGLTLHRIASLPGIHDVPIGLSVRKLVCDVWLARTFTKLVRTGRFDVIHAGEEAAYLAYLLRRLHRRPYVIDMDSSVPDQIEESFPRLGPWLRPLRELDRRTMRQAVAVTAVGEHLAGIARRARDARDVHVIRDVADFDGSPAARDYRDDLHLDPAVSVGLYVGNLEPYQGIELLLDSVARIELPVVLVIIGGSLPSIERYRRRATQMGIDSRIHWLGPRPLAELPSHLARADVLVSPRVRGENTPMKIYSYLASAVPIVATDIPSHTEVLDDSVARLAAPNPAAFSTAWAELLADASVRERIGRAARERARARHGRDTFVRQVEALYHEVEDRMGSEVVT